jgi:hypothetical protein
MYVFLNGAKEKANPSHFMHVAPAFTPVADITPRSDWFDRDGNPENLKVEFQYGCATVSDTLGRWLIATGHASRGSMRQTGRSLLGSLAATIAVSPR